MQIHEKLNLFLFRKKKKKILLMKCFFIYDSYHTIRLFEYLSVFQFKVSKPKKKKKMLLYFLLFYFLDDSSQFPEPTQTPQPSATPEATYKVISVVPNLGIVLGSCISCVVAMILFTAYKCFAKAPDEAQPYQEQFLLSQKQIEWINVIFMHNTWWLFY